MESTTRRLPDHKTLPLKRHPALCTLLSALLLAGCGERDEIGETGAGAGADNNFSSITNTIENSDTGTSAVASCSIEDMRSWVYEGMLDYYLFYDQVDTNVQLDDYNSVESLITDLRVAPFDTFSHITDEQSYTAQFEEGVTIGFGWVLTRDDNFDVFFKMIEPESPLANANVQRGDHLVKINGVDAFDYIVAGTEASEALFSFSEEPVSADFTIRSVNGITRTITVEKSEYPIQTVLDTQVVQHLGADIGYLNYYQFLGSSSVELAQAFEALDNADVSELVLDLRYNLGGSVLVSSELGSYIAGNGKTDEPFAIYRPNDKYAEFATEFNFMDVANALSLNRVFVLQGSSTCSASELIVNGLRPYMEVITIGGTSCGKPYASIPNPYCGKVMNALQLEAVNAAGVGGYYSGIEADCVAEDDISQTLGDTSENLFSTALNYIAAGSCSGFLSNPAHPGAMPGLLNARSRGMSYF